MILKIIHNCELLPYLKANEITPDHLFATHEHFDHIEGIGDIKNAYPNMKVYAVKSASEMFSDEACNMSLFFEGHNISEPKADIEIIENSVFDIDDKNIQCYLTPGHTHGCMIIKIDNMLFSGDTILNNTKIPTNLPTSSKEQLIKSLDFIDSHFGDDIIIYSGHGEKFYKKDWNKAVSLGKNKIIIL